MRLVHRAAAATAAALLAAILALPSSAGSYVKIGDIKGDVSEPGHRDWIEISGFGGSGVSGVFSFLWFGGQAAHNEFWFEKKIDKASPGLREAMDKQTRFPRATFETVAKGHVWKTTYDDVRIVAVEQQAGRMEKVTFAYERSSFVSLPAGPNP